MRVGCGSATIGIFAKQWFGKVDDVVVVDDHITGVLSEHQAGKLDRRDADGIAHKEADARRRVAISGSPTPAQVGEEPTSPIPSTILDAFDRQGRPGRPDFVNGFDHRRAQRLSSGSTRRCVPCEADMPDDLARSVALIAENCEPALSTVLFMGGAGGSLRAGVTENPDPPDALGQGRADARHLRRGAGLCLARRGHHLHG